MRIKDTLKVPQKGVINVKKYFISEQKAPLIPKKWLEKPWVLPLVRVISVIAALLCPVYSFIMTEYLHFGSTHRLSLFLEKGKIPLFGLLVFLVLYLLLVLLVKKLWCASLIMTLGAITVGLVNRFKFSSTGDYFYPWDIQQAGNLDELSQFVAPNLTLAAVIAIILAFAFPIVGFIAKTELPFTALPRIAAAVLIVICLSVSFSTPKKTERIINSFDIYFEDTALQGSNYEANGFTGAFTLNLLSANVTTPAGYGREAVSEILAGKEYEEADGNFAYPDIILILSESFWNPKLINGAEFSEDPFANFEAITERDGVISGRMFQTGFGGGTVRPEFEVLTGLTTDGLPAGSVPWRYIEEPTESYVSVLRDIGYETYAIHPYLSRFYDRARAYPLIGIDNLYFEEDLTLIEEVEVTYESVYSYVSDKSFESYLEYFLDSGRSEAPRFIFGISMENHQAYLGKYEACPMQVKCEGLSESSLDALANFAYGVLHADEALASLTEYIDGRERPTVLVYYGDHLPSLGANYAAYLESGTIGDIYNRTKEEYELMQATPFLIYANYELPCSSELPFSSELLCEGKDNDIASYNLMNAVFDLIGAPKTALCTFLEEYASVIPFYNTRLGISPDDDEMKYILAHRILTFDRISAGNRYSID